MLILPLGLIVIGFVFVLALIGPRFIGGREHPSVDAAARSPR